MPKLDDPPRRPSTPALTFLQYVCTRLIGAPVRHGAKGESWWHCPLGLHTDKTPSFHTLPAKQGCRDYWKCFGCHRGGDEFQLLRHLRETGHKDCQGGYEEHKVRLTQWRMEYDSLTTQPQRSERSSSSTAPAGVTAGSPGFSHFVEVEDPLTAGLGYSADPFDIEEAYRNATDNERAALVMAERYARTAGVDLKALARFAFEQEQSYARWLRDMDSGRGVKRP